MTFKIDPSALRRTLLTNGYEPIALNGKRPVEKEWSKGQITPGRLDKTAAEHPDATNTGLRAGYLSIVDIDIVDTSLCAKIEAAITPALSDTLFRRVGSKGCALCYYNSEPIGKITVSVGGKRFVEFLGVGQQVAAYGIHPDAGKPYEWTNADLGAEPLQARLKSLPHVSPEMLRGAAYAVRDALLSAGLPDAVVTGDIGAPVTTSGPSPSCGAPTTAAAVEDMVRAIPPDCDRNTWLIVCAGLVTAPVHEPDWNGLDLFIRWSRGDFHGYRPEGFKGPDDCEAEWRRDAEKRARGEEVPPFGALVDVARAHGWTGNPFYVPPAAVLFGPIARALSQAHGPVPFRDVLSRTVLPVREIIGGLLERGTVTFLSAPGGSHKSRLAVQWGLSIDAGISIFGRAVERSRFIYVSYEDHADEVARRAQAIARRLKLPQDSEGQFWDLSGRDAPLALVQESGDCVTQPFWGELCGALRAIPGHKFVAIDSCYNALRFAGSAKINEGAVMAGISLLQRLCDDCDCTLLVLWHPSQSGQERGDASGWSVAWHNAPRARLSLTPVKEAEDAFDLRVEKRNHGPKGKPLTLHWSDGVLLPYTETDTTEQKAAFLNACVHVAIAAAEQGAPVQKQRRLNTWMLDMIERAIGRRPSEREAKEELARGLSVGRLRYVNATQKRTAGYYPPDPDKAAALAIAAKHLEREAPDAQS